MISAPLYLKVFRGKLSKLEENPHRLECRSRVQAWVVDYSKRKSYGFLFSVESSRLDPGCLKWANSFMARKFHPTRAEEFYFLTIYVSTGRQTAHVSLNGEPVKLAPGSYVVANPLTEFAWGRGAFQGLIVNCSQTMLRSCRDAVGITSRLGPFDFSPLPRRPAPPLQRLFARLDRLVRGAPPADHRRWGALRCYHLGYEVLEALWFTHPSTLRERFTEAPEEDQADGRLQHVIAYFRAHLQEAIQIEKVGREAGLGHSNLFRLFQQELRCTPAAYLRRLRLEQAERLRRRHPRITLNQVAQRVGYRSSSELGRALRALKP